MIRKMVIVFCLLYSFQAMAVIETYEFKNESQQDRYQSMIDELRCPKCQNQNLAGSNSPIAADLRRELYRMIEEGQNDDAIKQFMVSRYGNFILYRPPVDKNTLVLWSLPGVLVVFALLIAIKYRYRLAKTDPHQPLSESEKQQLAAILEKYS